MTSRLENRCSGKPLGEDGALSLPPRLLTDLSCEQGGSERNACERLRKISDAYQIFRVLDSHPLGVTPSSASRALGLRRSSDLERFLARHGLPRFEVLREWYCLYVLHKISRESSLQKWTESHGTSAPAYHRFLKMRFRLSWTELAKMNEDDVGGRVLTAWTLYGLSAQSSSRSKPSG